MTPDRVRIAQRARWLQIIAALLIGVAIFGLLWGQTRLSLAFAIVVLFVQLFAIEGLRLSTSNIRENP